MFWSFFSPWKKVKSNKGLNLFFTLLFVRILQLSKNFRRLNFFLQFSNYNLTSYRCFTFVVFQYYFANKSINSMHFFQFFVLNDLPKTILFNNFKDVIHILPNWNSWKFSFNCWSDFEIPLLLGALLSIQRCFFFTEARVKQDKNNVTTFFL